MDYPTYNFGDPMSMKKIYIPSGPLVMTNIAMENPL